MDRPITFGEAHALYTPPRGTGMTLRQAEAFIDRYGWLLQREGERVRDWLAGEQDRQGIMFQTNPDRSPWDPVRVFDTVAVARHVNTSTATSVIAGYVHYRWIGNEPHSVVLHVAWETERVFAVWHGPIHPPDWGVDETEHHRWRV